MGNFVSKIKFTQNNKPAAPTIHSYSWYVYWTYLWRVWPGMGCTFLHCIFNSHRDTKKDDVNAQNYMIENEKATQKWKLPGTVNGEQFIIQNCSHSAIFILDFSNTVTVDECDHCTLIFGPVKRRYARGRIENGNLRVPPAVSKWRSSFFQHIYQGLLRLYDYGRLWAVSFAGLQKSENLVVLRDETDYRVVEKYYVLVFAIVLQQYSRYMVFAWGISAESAR